MMNSSEIREHMKVVGSDGQHVGTVDRVQGNNIKLTKNDPTAGGQHHVISMDMVDTIENDAVKLNMPAQDVMSQWKSGETQDTQSMNAAGAGAGAGSWSSMSGSDTSMPNQGSMGTSSSDDDSQRGSGSMGYK
jgi:hypothetical protein